MQEEIDAWVNLLITTRGCLKPEECFWYLLEYGCMEGVWDPADISGCKLDIPSDSRAPIPIFSLDPHGSRDTMDVKNCPAEGNMPYLEPIRHKINTWID